RVYCSDTSSGSGGSNVPRRRGDRMRRRDLMSALVAAAVGRAAAAQGPQVPAIGFLSAGSPAEYAERLAGFRRALADAGYVEGRTVAIEFRWAEGRYDRLPALAAQLVNRPVAAILAASLPAALAAKAATATIPIVFVSGADPVTFGLVPSLSR